MNKKLVSVTSWVAMAVLSLVAVSRAEATSIKLKSGLTTVTVVDGGVGDLTGAIPDGIIVFSGAVGTFTVNSTTGTSKPILGSQTSPVMDLLDLSISSSAGGTLEIWFSDDDFGPVGGTAVRAGIGGTSGATSLTYETFKGDDGVMFDEDVLLTTQSFGPGVFSGATTASAAFGPAFSLTQKVTLVHSGASFTSFDGALSVPDGGMTLSLLGLGLVGVAGLRRKFWPPRA